MSPIRLVRYLPARSRLAILALWLLGLGTIALALVLPNQVGRLTSLFSDSQQVTWGPIYRAIVLLVSAQLGISVLSLFKRRIEVKLEESAVRSLTLDLFKRVLRFSADFFRDREVERINSRALDDTNRVARFFMEMVIAMPLAVVSIVTVGALLVLKNWPLGICMILLSLLFGYFIFFDRRIQAINRKARETWDSIRTQASEVVSGVSEVRNHAAFDYGLQGLTRSFDSYRTVMTDVGRLSGLFQAMSPLVMTLQTVALFWIGAALCIRGALQWGDVIAFYLLAVLFQRPVSEIANFILQWRMAQESMKRVTEYLDRPCAFVSAEGAPIPDLAASNVSFDRVDVALPTGAKILDAFHLQVPPGRHVALVGPAGCGKSTAIQLLVRGVDPTAGQVSVGAIPLKDHDHAALARRIALVPQRPVVFNSSIRSNILFGLRRHSEQVLRDSEGDVDVTQLPGVRTLADLDRELLAVVRRTGLEGDVFKKCLDHPLPPGKGAERLGKGIEDFRLSLRSRLMAESPSLIAPFDSPSGFPGTVYENLFGPGSPGEGALARGAERVLDSLRDSALHPALLKLGWVRSLSDRALAVRLAERAPALAEFMPAQERVKGEASDLPAMSAERLVGLSRRHQLLLIEVALEGGALQDEPARQVVPHLLEARSRVTAAGGPDPFRLSGCREGVSLRENLLGGRVNPQVLRGVETADSLVWKVLEEKGELQTVLLLGMEASAGEGGKFLSGGQRQKVVLARALLKRPDLLLLDEATANLDELSQSLVMNTVREDFARKTVVSISHRLSTIRDFDHIVVLDRGKVAQEGPYDLLASQEGLLADLVRQQAAGGRTAGTDRRAATDTELRRRLAACPLFSRLRGEHLELLERVTRHVECPRGEVLFKRGDPGDDLFVIVKGEVEFFVDTPQGEQTLTAYGPGRVFGELAVFGGGTRTASARARADAVLCVIPREPLFRLIHGDPQIAIGLLEGISRRMAEITDAAHGPLAAGGG